MKNLFSLLLAVLAFNISYSQCDPDFDFGDAVIGVSPDPLLGEDLLDGMVGQDYNDVLHILLPAEVLDIDDTLPVAPGTLLDSLELISIVLVDENDESIQYLPEEIGISVICNNNDTGNNPCTFPGDGQYCASIEGVPTIPGNFRCDITIKGWILVLGYPFGQEALFGSIYLNIGSGGCTDMEACNYDPAATVDDGTCIYDCLGCTDDTATNFDENATTDNGTCCYLALDYNVENPMCFGEYGAINTVVTGIYPETELELTLDGESSETGSFDVMAGIYTITATVMTEGVLNCSVTLEVIVTQPEELAIDASATSASVLGNATGTATISGGTGDVQISWSDANGNLADASDLTEGVYIVTAADENGCTAEANVTVLWDYINELHSVEFNLYPNPSEGTVNINSATNIGDVELMILDGVGRVVYTTSITNMTSQNVLNLNNLEAGSYSIAIITSNGRAVKSLQIVK
jgi:hypothetical protein